jgi:pyruvoyl-dependent arginine decarboxylase (PvlArgDC)
MMDKILGAAKSKTMWFSLALVIFGVIEVNVSLLQSIIPPQYYGLVVMGIGVTTAVLRWLTTAGLDKK